MLGVGKWQIFPAAIGNLFNDNRSLTIDKKLDLESIMSSLRMDFEKEGISIGIDWDLEILNKLQGGGGLLWCT